MKKKIGMDIISDIISREIHLTTLPKKYGGKGFKPKDYFSLLKELALEYPSVSLGISMHLYTTWGLNYLMSEEQKNIYFNRVRNENALFASLNEPGLYFVNPKQINPSDFPITAKKTQEGYILNGRKKFVSFEPYVTFLPVYVLVESENNEPNGIAVVIVDKNSPGVIVEDDWNSISMADTSSNSILLKDVFVDKASRICPEGKGLEQTEILGYLFRLSVSSVSYGMAHKALSYITDYSKTAKVPHTNKPLAFFPGVQYSLAEMLINLNTSYSQIDYYCTKLEEYLDKGDLYKNNELNISSLITKDYVVKSAQEVVNAAMKIQGIRSLDKDNLLANLYSDVKAGEFHPPQRDVIYEIIAKQHFGIISLRNRW
ncbi:acyl-CoA dehydrogenase family protein [Bacillus pacificus]|uniref:acyl-CoA dehydrogenase family protein n=1 Tax=Bacillus pacificus TaxID=2026187 RepID=UPI002E1D61D4|nr:acyl-CoA/acyl-ACP dehydrogenase [Bacillus pacificus]